jgi:hypothetical protein
MVRALEATMQAVPRHEWIEFLDALHVDGEVDLVSSHLEHPDGVPWTIRSADFDPFEHVIEMILDNHEISIRLLIDNPRKVEFEGDEQSPSRLLIGSDDGVVEVTGR